MIHFEVKMTYIPGTEFLGAG